MPLFHCSATLCYHRGTLPLFHYSLLSVWHSTIVPLFHHPLQSLWHSTIVPLFHQTLVSLYYCSTVPPIFIISETITVTLYYRSSVPPHFTITVTLYYCSTVPPLFTITVTFYYRSTVLPHFTITVFTVTLHYYSFIWYYYSSVKTLRLFRVMKIGELVLYSWCVNVTKLLIAVTQAQAVTVEWWVCAIVLNTIASSHDLRINAVESEMASL